MEVREIPVDSLDVSQLNVRKTLTSEEDETGISDLANDIRTNGLINPITVRRNGLRYEVIAGQRRYLACKMLNKRAIPCNIVDVTTQKAEEISLVENVQRNPMTTVDKVKTYARLYEVYGKDLDRVVHAVNVSRLTLSKYIKLSSLPEAVLKLLDTSGDQKITIEVAVELTKLSAAVDKLKLLQNISSLTTTQKIRAIREFVENECDDADDIDDIKQDIAMADNNVKLAPSFPYVRDSSGQNIRIPESLWPDVIQLIKQKMGGLQYV